MSAWTEESFRVADALIFIGATGIAVRYVAPFLKNKAVDPAVICMDDKGTFVIPLLSGHIGGANDLAKEIADGIGSIPVITTATDIHDKFSVDSFAVNNDLHIGSLAAAKEISSAIVDEKKVGLVSDVPVSNVPPELDLNGNEDLGVFISYGLSEGPFKRTLKLTPRCHILGIGCRKDTPLKKIEALVYDILDKEGISKESVKSIASIDLKSNEPGLLEFCKKIKAEPVFFPSDVLASLPDVGFTSSEMVKKVTGVDNVCERAAVAASDGGELIVRKTPRDGVTLAVVREPVSLDLMRK